MIEWYKSTTTTKSDVLSIILAPKKVKESVRDPLLMSLLTPDGQ